MAEPVTIRQVEKTFRQGNERLSVLHQVNLEIAPGEFVAVLGPSGCGKSTLLRLIAGLDRPTSGEVTLGGRVVEPADTRCAVVFQEPRLFPWKTVAANVAVGARRLPDRPSIATWLERVGLSGFGDSYPYQLSGGMAQRAALARALISRPGVLLLDEPFAALDALTRLQMQDLLLDVCSEVAPTVIMVTHDVDEALHLADRVVLMGPRPATVVRTLTVDRPRPRARGDAVLAAMRDEILGYFGFLSCTQPAAQPESAEAGYAA
ncbi:MAG TPA: ABC transporter ATP-binding protein [Thermomicrobiales bacterium]